ncbi:MAG: hypothetical protein MJ215_02510 [Spirochaetia bacterium]|nr:hypothetical protein [Spirochaetia bacterium]
MKKIPAFSLILCFFMTVLISSVTADGSDASSAENSESSENQSAVKVPFSEKFNNFIRPFTFGVGTEPGIDKNAVYVFLMYDYSEKYSSSIKFTFEGNTSKEHDLDVDEIFYKPENKYLELNKSTTFEIDFLPIIWHFSKCDFGTGVFFGYYNYDTEGVYNTVGKGSHIDSDTDLFYLGPMLYYKFELEMGKYVKFGGITEFFPVAGVKFINHSHIKNYTVSSVDEYTDKDTKYGVVFPYVYQIVYFTCFKYFNFSTSVEYEHYSIGHNTKYLVDNTIWRYGVAILKKPKGMFLSFLGGIFYEHEWESIDVPGSHSLDHDGRWVFCLGAST